MPRFKKKHSPESTTCIQLASRNVPSVICTYAAKEKIMHIQKTVISGIALLSFSALLTAQPPAQGPPLASANAASWPVFSFNNLVKAQVDTTVTSINSAIAARGDVHATIVPSVLSYSPLPQQTQYPDQPNSRYYSIPYILNFKVQNIEYKKGIWLPYPWSRNISISMNLNISCNAWQTGNGTLTIVTAGQPPYLDPEHDTTEEIVDQFLGGWLIKYVDSQIMQGVSGVVSTSLNFGSCVSLGAVHPDPNTTAFDAILWDKPTGTHHQSILTAFNSVAVRPLSIKRLPAHAFGGGVLYQDVETPQLEFWADFGTWDYQLPQMVEGQEVTLSTAPNIAVPVPAPGNPLVIIASTAQTNGARDSAYETFSKETNFGSGIQTIIVNKVYWQPPQPPLTTKPTKFLVPGYQITFQVTGPASVSTRGTFGVSP
jgi:hypothetical protein